MKPLDHYNQLNSYLVSAPHPASDTVLQKAPAQQPIMNWLRSALKRVGTATLKLLDSSPEPRIAKRFDRWGNIYFSAYDPVDQTHHVFTSELEIRIWLEQRYYR